MKIDDWYNKDELLAVDNDDDAAVAVDSNLRLILVYEEGCTDSKYW